MFMQQQIAQQMQGGNVAGQHPEFFHGQPHLGPSAFPIDGVNTNFAMQNSHPMMGVVGSVGESHNMDVTGTMAGRPNFMAFDQAPDFTLDQFNMTNVQDFAMYGDMTNMDGMEYPFLPGAPMQATQSNGSTPSIPSTLSSMPSHSTIPSSVGGLPATSVGTTQWNDERKPTICFSDASEGIVGPQAAYCSPPEDSNTARWVSQQGPFDQTSSPEELVERPNSSQNLPPTPPDSKLHGELDLPQEAFSRRPSSTNDLSESLGNVDIQAQPVSIDTDFKQPGEPSSLAARRQRPRPAALGQASLRSASYSAGMPISPGNNPNNLSAPEQQLRRIRSSGVPGATSGRVQKQNATGQRSPMHMNFADSAASPKFARQASTYATASNDGVQSLAPPTPLTPHEEGRFPSWQSHRSVNSHHNSIDHSSPHGFAASWTTESPALFQPHNVSSPPETPLDAAQTAQYNEYLNTQNIYRDTPPQSAPAFQQSFNGAVLGPQVPYEHYSLGMDPAHAGHIRRPSLPEQSKMMAPQAPMYHAPASDMPLNYHTVPFEVAHMQQMPQPQATLPSQTTAAFPTPPQPAPAPIPTQNNMLQADFAVHEYLPPGVQSRVKNSSSPALVEQASGPKMFHFSNTGPKDFAGQA